MEPCFRIKIKWSCRRWNEIVTYMKFYSPKENSEHISTWIGEHRICNKCFVAEVLTHLSWTNIPMKPIFSKSSAIKLSCSTVAPYSLRDLSTSKSSMLTSVRRSAMANSIFAPSKTHAVTGISDSFVTHSLRSHKRNLSFVFRSPRIKPIGNISIALTWTESKMKSWFSTFCCSVELHVLFLDYFLLLVMPFDPIIRKRQCNCHCYILQALK